MKDQANQGVTGTAHCCGGVSIAFLRIFVGWIFIRAGLSKAFGFFDGPGIENFVGYLRSLEIMFPLEMAYVVAWLELICGLLLVLGVLSRMASIPIIVIMTYAIYRIHPTDFHYPAVILLSAVVFLQYGSGTLSLDRLIQQMRQHGSRKKNF